MIGTGSSGSLKHRIGRPTRVRLTQKWLRADRGHAQREGNEEPISPTSHYVLQIRHVPPSRSQDRGYRPRSLPGRSFKERLARIASQLREFRDKREEGAVPATPDLGTDLAANHGPADIWALAGPRGERLAECRACNGSPCGWRSYGGIVLPGLGLLRRRSDVFGERGAPGNRCPYRDSQEPIPNRSSRSPDPIRSKS